MENFGKTLLDKPAVAPCGEKCGLGTEGRGGASVANLTVFYGEFTPFIHYYAKFKSTIRRSQTFVPVGPVRSRASNGAKKL